MDPQFIVWLDGSVGEPRSHHSSSASASEGVGLSPSPAGPLLPPGAETEPALGAGGQGSPAWEGPRAFGVETGSRLSPFGPFP